MGGRKILKKNNRRQKVVSLSLTLLTFSMVIILPPSVIAVNGTIDLNSTNWRMNDFRSESNGDFESWTGSDPIDWDESAELGTRPVKWRDDCSSADGWVAQSTWPQADVSSIQTGISLYSDGSGIYSGSIPSSSSSNHGPVYAKSIGAGMNLKDNLNFEVDLQHIYHSSKMGHVYVTLHDTNNERVFTIRCVDAWYATRSDVGVMYWYTSAEGGGYEYEYVEMSQSWSGVMRIYYDAGYIMGSIFATLYTLCEPGEFDSDRTISHITVSYGNKKSYYYESKYVRDIEINAEVPLKESFEDDCSSSSGWSPQSWWQQADVKIQTGISLNSDGSKLYSGSIPGDSSHGNHGPVFLKPLGTIMRLGDNLDFRVDLQHIYHSSKMGHVYVTLYDIYGERVFYIRCVDAWYASRSDPGVFYWRSADEGGGYEYAYKQKSGSWSGELRLWYENGYIKGNILGTTYTLCDPGEFDPDRQVGSITVSYGNKYTFAYESKYVRDIEVTCDQTFSSSEWDIWKDSYGRGGSGYSFGCESDGPNVVLKTELNPVSTILNDNMFEFSFYFRSLPFTRETAQAGLEYKAISDGQTHEFKGDIFISTGESGNLGWTQVWVKVPVSVSSDINWNTPPEVVIRLFGGFSEINVDDARLAAYFEETDDVEYSGYGVIADFTIAIKIWEHVSHPDPGKEGWRQMRLTSIVAAQRVENSAFETFTGTETGILLLEIRTTLWPNVLIWPFPPIWDGHVGTVETHYIGEWNDEEYDVIDSDPYYADDITGAAMSAIISGLITAGIGFAMGGPPGGIGGFLIGVGVSFGVSVGLAIHGKAVDDVATTPGPDDIVDAEFEYTTYCRQNLVPQPQLASASVYQTWEYDAGESDFEDWSLITSFTVWAGESVYYAQPYYFGVGGGSLTIDL